MHAQNFALGIRIIEKDQEGEAYWVTLHMSSGRELHGSITAQDGVFVWLMTDEPKPKRVLVDVNYVESITPTFERDL